VREFTVDREEKEKESSLEFHSLMRLRTEAISVIEVIRTDRRCDESREEIRMKKRLHLSRTKEAVRLYAVQLYLYLIPKVAHRNVEHGCTVQKLQLRENTLTRDIRPKAEGRIVKAFAKMQTSSDPRLMRVAYIGSTIR
jgi:hypothetical protein